MTHRSYSAVGQDRFELWDECTAGPMQQSAAHGETAAGVALRTSRADGAGQLRLRIPRLREVRADRDPPAERGIRVGRAAALGGSPRDPTPKTRAPRPATTGSGSCPNNTSGASLLRSTLRHRP
jgi:hypothetical protein